MKSVITTFFVISLSLAVSSAQVISKEIPIKLGAKSFHEGDVISIIEAKSTSDKMQIGDTVTIKGKYRLDSVDSANLLLLTTRTKTKGAIEIDKSQKLKAIKGWHEFELSAIIKHEGILHLTFYSMSGKPFGGVYFGTADQSEELNKMSVAHYNSK